MRILLLILCLIIPMIWQPLLISAQTSPLPSLRMMEWNLENLFDVYDDPDTNDEDFTPLGSYQWTRGRYWRKLDEVAKVIAAMGQEDGLPPQLVALCEVESDSVLTDLTRRSPLRTLRYEYTITHGNDPRGINVALMWLPGTFSPDKTTCIRVKDDKRGRVHTRDILYVRGLIHTDTVTDTLHVLVTHLPSRQGGQDNTRNRQLAAETLWTIVDSLLQRPEAKVVVTGDFNATAKDRIFRYAPLHPTDPPTGGSYCFRGEWSYIDHFCLSPALARSPHSVSAQPLPWLLEPNATTGRDQPFRTYRGPAYHGGISDHLPMKIDIELNNET